MLADDPFVDRDRLRDQVELMAQGVGKRHLAISGAADLGKSYSMVFLTHVAAHSKTCQEHVRAVEGGLRIVVEDLREFEGLPSDDQLPAVGRELLDRAGIWSDEDEAAQRSSDAKSIATRLRRKISTSNQQWWICFDSIDHPKSLMRTRLHELINAVAALTSDLQLQVRVVLGGQRVREFLADPAIRLPGLLRQIEMTLVPAEQVADWVRSRMQEQGQAPPQGDLKAQLVDFVQRELDLSAEEVEAFQRVGWPPREVASALPAFLATLIPPQAYEDSA